MSLQSLPMQQRSLVLGWRQEQGMPLAPEPEHETGWYFLRREMCRLPPQFSWVWIYGQSLERPQPQRLLLGFPPRHLPLVLPLAFW